jgi:REP element-mobilizing transposase RayT
MAARRLARVGEEAGMGHLSAGPRDGTKSARAHDRTNRVLSDQQRAIVERTIADHCAIRKWKLHAVNARTNHVHVVVTADRDPDDVRNRFKAWCSRKLSEAAGLRERVAKSAGRKHWFTEGGDAELIDNEEYLENAIRYVEHQ